VRALLVLVGLSVALRRYLGLELDNFCHQGADEGLHVVDVCLLGLDLLLGHLAGQLQGFELLLELLADGRLGFQHLPELLEVFRVDFRLWLWWAGCPGGLGDHPLAGSSLRLG